MAVTYQKLDEITSADIASLRRGLAAERKAIDERERALDLVEDMLRKKAPAQQSGAGNGVPPQTPPEPGGFTETVRRVVTTSFGASEFSVADIEAAMDTLGFPLPKKDPRSRIAMVVKEMLDDKKIVRIFQGEGRTPHRYKVNT